ncbi:TetR/AcrR family transcriptional regulator [Nannocystis pusilla]|uniref:TetR/AcrR family transcriptional regulator n=1 Tax=Nannocystis pusilla TaxID=889268 RepID=UPI003DA3B775
MKKLRADGQRNRERIVAAAAELVARDGAQASLEEVAQRAGVGSATLHRHFASRQALLEAVFRAGVAQLCERAAALPGEDPSAELAAWLEEVTVYAATHRGLATALLAGPDGLSPEEVCCTDMLLGVLERPGGAGVVGGRASSRRHDEGPDGPGERGGRGHRERSGEREPVAAPRTRRDPASSPDRRAQLAGVVTNASVEGVAARTDDEGWLAPRTSPRRRRWCSTRRCSPSKRRSRSRCPNVKLDWRTLELRLKFSNGKQTGS